MNNNRKTDAKKLDKLLKSYKEFITLVGGVATITMVAIFITHFIKLGTLGTEHWVVKRSVMIGLLWSGLSAALLGSGTLIFAIVYNAFN